MEDIKDLAKKIDWFMYNYDTYIYNDMSLNRRKNTEFLEKRIREKEVEDIIRWFSDILSSKDLEKDDPDRIMAQEIYDRLKPFHVKDEDYFSYYFLQNQ